MLSEFANVFERKIWRVQVAHLHNEARALSSPSRCFQLSTNLGKDFFRYLWYCGKKQIECGLTWHYWSLGSTDLGLINWHVFEQSECRNCCLYIIIQKIAPQAESGKYFQIWFFPRFGGKNGGVLSMRMQVILDSSFARPGSAPTRGGKKGEFRDWTRMYKVDESGTIFGTWYLRLVPSAFWYNRRPGYHFMPGFQVAYGSWICIIGTCSWNV